MASFTTCPVPIRGTQEVCGAELQRTDVTEYYFSECGFSLDKGALMCDDLGVITGESEADSRFYCANDHTERDIVLALNFASFGELVEREAVPSLVAAGLEVWSYGYAWDQSGDDFTTVDMDDLVRWRDSIQYDDIMRSWQPFRVAPLTKEEV